MKMKCLVVSLSFAVAAWSGWCAGQEQSDIKAIIANLGSANRADRTAAQRALAQIPLKDLADPLVESLTNEDADVRAEALKWLGRTRFKRTAPPVIKLLMEDPESKVRLQAARTLGLLHSVDAVKPLRAAMQGTDEEIRQAAMESLIMLDPKGNADVLKACLASTDKDIRRKTLVALPLTTVLDNSFVPLMTGLLDDDDLTIADHAARILGDIGDPSSAAAIVAALEKRGGFKLNFYATDALVKLQGQDAAGTLINLLQTIDPSYRRPRRRPRRPGRF